MVSISLRVRVSQESVNKIITQIDNVLNYTVSKVGLAQIIGCYIDKEVNNFNISPLLKMNCTNPSKMKENDIINLFQRSNVFCLLVP